MPTILYKCEKCNLEKKVSFKVGCPPKAPICEVCNDEMIRSFGKVDLGEVESDLMANVKLTMKNSQSFTGKDKSVY